MLGVGGVFEDGDSSPVDSAVVDALQRGQWSPGDLLCSLYRSLRAFAVHSRSTQDELSTMQLLKLLRISGDKTFSAFSENTAAVGPSLPAAWF